MKADIIKTDKKYIAGTYNRFPVVAVSGKGSVITDENGKKYIDMGSGIGVTSFGFSDKKWLEAVCGQAAAIQHTSNLYYTGPCARLAEMLCQRTEAVNPERLLKRGYSITLHKGRAVHRAEELKAGDEIETRLEHGTIKSRIYE